VLPFLEKSTYRPINANSEEKAANDHTSVFQQLIRASLFLGTVVVVLALSITVAHAQAGSTNAPTSILEEYKSLEGQWISKLFGAAQRLFVLLAGIEVIWSFTLLALEKADFQLLTATIIRKIMWISIFYALLLYGVTPDGGGWIPAILNSFQLLGQNASSIGPLGPSAIVGFGVNTAVDLLSAASDAGFLTDMGTALTLVFCAVVIFISYLAVAIQFVVALVESYLVIGGGVILLGFGGSRWTAPYVERYIAYAVSVGLKILILYLLVGAGMTLSQGWAGVALGIGNSAEPARTGFDLGAAAVMFLAVCWMSPKLASAVLGGASVLTGGDLAAVGVGFGSGAASAAMTGAALAGSGTSALGKVQAASAASNGPTNGRGPASGGGSSASPSFGSPPPGSAGGGGASAALPSAPSQPSPPARVAETSAGQQPGPPSLGRRLIGLAERAFAVAEQTSAATRSGLRNLRIPHDGGGHSPPKIPTDHGES
jgi:type IV secretion system protein TrbL